MKTLTSTLALLTAMMVSGSAIAQVDPAPVETDDEGQFGADAEIEAFDDMDAASRLSNRTGLSTADVVAILQATPDSSAGIAAVNDVSAGGEVHVIAISDLQGENGENAAAVSQALAALEASRLALQAAVEANATVRNALQQQNLLAANVVAVHAIEEGRIVVVVDDGPV